MGSLLKCMSLSKNGRSSGNNTEFKSVLEIDAETNEENGKSKPFPEKHKSCCRFEFLVPARILKLFHGDVGMTRLEKSKCATRSCTEKLWYFK